MSTSAAITDRITSSWQGLVIADVMPALIAMDRKAPLIPLRSGSPKLILDAPQVVLQPSSLRIRPRISNTWRPA